MNIKQPFTMGLVILSILSLGSSNLYAGAKGKPKPPAPDTSNQTPSQAPSTPDPTPSQPSNPGDSPSQTPTPSQSNPPSNDQDQAAKSSQQQGVGVGSAVAGVGGAAVVGMVGYQAYKKYKERASKEGASKEPTHEELLQEPFKHVMGQFSDIMEKHAPNDQFIIDKSNLSRYLATFTPGADSLPDHPILFDEDGLMKTKDFKEHKKQWDQLGLSEKDKFEKTYKEVKDKVQKKGNILEHYNSLSPIEKHVFGVGGKLETYKISHLREAFNEISLEVGPAFAEAYNKAKGNPERLKVIKEHRAKVQELIKKHQLHNEEHTYKAEPPKG